jgi:hypothetical protein
MKGQTEHVTVSRVAGARRPGERSLGNWRSSVRTWGGKGTANISRWCHEGTSIRRLEGLEHEDLQLSQANETVKQDLGLLPEGSGLIDESEPDL